MNETDAVAPIPPTTIELTAEQQRLLAPFCATAPEALRAGAVPAPTAPALERLDRPGFEVIPAGQGQSQSRTG
jgi:hypothetical protein